MLLIIKKMVVITLSKIIKKLYIVTWWHIKQFLLKIYIISYVAMLVKTVKNVCLASRPSVE